MIPPRILAVLCLFSLISWTSALEISCDSFTFKFTSDGQPESCLRHADKAEFVPKGRGGEGFYLKSVEGKLERMVQLSLLPNDRLLAATADGSKQVRFAIHRGKRSVAFRIESVEGIDSARGESFHFKSLSDDRLRVLSLDYMTRANSRSYGIFVDWSDFWNRAPGRPLGGFVMYERTGDDDEDETLLHLWADEMLLHPNVPDAWTVERARAWLAQWQQHFTDRTQMILAGQSLAELNEGLAFAKRAGVRQIYLFTDTWKPEPFWPNKAGNWEVNPKVFPRGEADLRSFAEAVRSQGGYLAVHYISGGIGMNDPKYIAQQPDHRLASWGKGVLIKAVSMQDRDLHFRPAPGVDSPDRRAVPSPSEAEWNWLRIGNELVRVGSVERDADGEWILHGCSRGHGSTEPFAHAAGAEVIGLFAAYGQNFVPGNDTSLLQEVAEGYAGLLNRCLIDHAEFDGAEIHAYEGWWGYQKFATHVYQALDHPTSAHDSRGQRPQAWLEYQFNSTKRLMAGGCPFTHGNWAAPVVVASPSRPASTLLDAHFFLSQGHRGGALGIAKPEPLFGVTPAMLKQHGLTDSFLEALATWKSVSALLTPSQHAQLEANFTAPKGERSRLFNHHMQSPIVPVARKVDGRLEIVPTRVLTRKTGDIPWQIGQEHGPISPRQFIQTGEPLQLINPLPQQPIQLFLHVLPAFNFAAPALPPTRTAANAPQEKSATETFTEGNDGSSTASRAASVSNILLQPTQASAIRSSGNSVASLNESVLTITARNATDQTVDEISQLPSWSVDADISARRGLGCWVTGDGSGAMLLIIIGSRDYVVPMDFTGRRYIEIPNGEVSWARSDWGWRMGTKSQNYGSIRQIKMGFGRIPPNTTATAKVEQLTALGEISLPLENPTLQVQNATIRFLGRIPTDHFLHYTGGTTAKLFDQQWQPKGELKVESTSTQMPTGEVSVSITTDPAKPRPWLDVQFIATGEPMAVGP